MGIRRNWLWKTDIFVLFKSRLKLLEDLKCLINKCWLSEWSGLGAPPALVRLHKPWTKAVWGPATHPSAQVNRGFDPGHRPGLPGKGRQTPHALFLRVR